MLAPQFSLRRLLGWVTVSAFVCLIGAAAVRGQLWAAGILLGLFALAVMFVVHGVTFALVRVIGLVRDRLGIGRARPPQDETATLAAPDSVPT